MIKISRLPSILSSPESGVLLTNAVLFGCIVASSIFWGSYFTRHNNGSAFTGQQPVRPGIARSGYVVTDLTGSQLFGDPGKNSIAPTKLPISSLNLKLTGVVSSTHGGFAMISVNGQPQEPFFVGEKINQGTVLDSVLPDRVILLRGGVRETLLLDPESAR